MSMRLFEVLTEIWICMRHETRENKNVSKILAKSCSETLTQNLSFRCSDRSMDMRYKTGKKF